MEIIGVPFDFCGKRSGSRLGPAAVRLAGLHEALRGIGLTVSDGGDIPAPQTPTEADGGLKNFVPGWRCVQDLKARVERTLRAQDLPLVLGGDHFIALGSIAAALSHFGNDLAVIWIDAHADLNTPATSPSGNLHGMPFAALLGLPSGCEGLVNHQWKELISSSFLECKLGPDRSAWFGLRELDAGEQNVINYLPGRFVMTMHDVDRWGVVQCLERFDRWMQTIGVRNLWISFDVDVLDPLLAPGTGTAVRGGLSYREMHIFGEVLYEILARPNCPYKLAGLDLVEINPLTDTNNITALTAVEWISSLFGKRILGPRP